MIARLRCDAGRIPLASASAHCCITSSPYFGLRAYRGVPSTVWGGDPSHAHEWGALRGERKDMLYPDLTFCACGAWRGTLGNEPTVDLYVAHIVECFREVKRVLRDDGVCWLVIGDSFGRGKRPSWEGDARRGANRRLAWVGYAEGTAQDESQDGSLLMVPWRVALALQADGWLVRNDVVWAKRAAMPESVSGARWERHRVRADTPSTGRDGLNGSGQRPHGSTIGEPQRAGAWPERMQQGHDGHEFAARARWTDCPGCEKCAANDGLVLRRGSGRPVRAHEVVLMLVKRMGYYYDDHAVRHKGLYGLREAEGVDGVLRQPRWSETGREDGPLCGLLPREGPLLPTVAAREGDDAPLGGGADSFRAARRTVTGVEKNGIRPTGDASVRAVREGARCEGSLPCLYEGQNNESRQSTAVLQGEPGALSGLLAGEEQGAEPLRPSSQVVGYEEGSGDDSPHKEPLQVRADGTGGCPTERYQATQPCTGGDLYDDAGRMGDDQSRGQRCLSLLWSDGSPVDAGSPDSLGEGWAPHAGEHRASLPELQQQEGDETSLATLRDVFILGPEPLRAAHFAAFPTALVEPLLLATCPARVCAKCGAPWARIVERPRFGKMDYAGKNLATDPQSAHRRLSAGAHAARLEGMDHDNPFPPTRTLDWRATCVCSDAATPLPGVVLDPFAGSGTVGIVAIRHRRRAALCDLSQTYLRDIVSVRTRNVQVEWL